MSPTKPGACRGELQIGALMDFSSVFKNWAKFPDDRFEPKLTECCGLHQMLQIRAKPSFKAFGGFVP